MDGSSGNLTDSCSKYSRTSTSSLKNTQKMEVMCHMPHGITLISPKNNNSCYLLSEQPASHLLQATPCTSSLLYSSSQNSAPLLSPLSSISPSDFFMPKFNFWPGITLPQTSAPHQKVPAPSQGCSTNSPTRQQTHDSSSNSSYLHS